MLWLAIQRARLPYNEGIKNLHVKDAMPVLQGAGWAPQTASDVALARQIVAAAELVGMHAAVASGDGRTLTEDMTGLNVRV